MTQSHRIDGGLIDRSKPLDFQFNGKKMQGYQGDTLASALLANGKLLVGRSFKYHRPRGILTAGSEEPNALVHLRSGAHTEPNTRATIAELYEGLEATSQNHRGSLEYDLLSVVDLLAPFFAAGFYYKTFMWPKAFWEKVYEPFIRNSAGLGAMSQLADPDTYDKGFLHCDILIIGAGPAGLMAALKAGRAGARVIIADEDFVAGGRLNAENYTIDDTSAPQWATRIYAELQALPNVQMMLRTSIIGAFDHGIYGALERVTDHLPSSAGQPRQILWRIYSKRAILAAGATERGIAFGNNDRPGVMLASAVRTYLNRYGVAPGQRLVVFTNNDDGWQTAWDFIAKGIEVAALVDSRSDCTLPDLPDVKTFKGDSVITTSGYKALKSITLLSGEKIATDCLAVAGGWNPNVHLTCHHRARPVWRADLAAFVPGSELPPGMLVAGAAQGIMGLSSACDSGLQAADQTLAELGITAPKIKPPAATDEHASGQAFWRVKQSRGRAWLDYQNDVTVKDIELAQREGYKSVELLKRYTTLGMATDQGKTANVNALAILAEAVGKEIPEVGTTIYRPPYSPVAIGALAGRSRGKEFRPLRRTPSHKWAVEQGATFTDAGLWKRAQWFSRDGENHWRETVNREVQTTRNNVGVCDVTTLGKVDIQGRDAATFLHRIYINNFATLAVGKVRYGLMLREDGIAMDDGTTARLGENHFVMTTTTAKAGPVYQHMEFCRQVLWPNLDVHLISTTDGWAQFSVAGPQVRAMLQTIVDPEHDISNEAFPYMACGEISVCGGTRARLFRISFSGEHAYELAVPARYGDAMIRVLAAAAKKFGGVVYGTEALGVMRIEKGHAAGNELNGQITAANLGMGRMLSKKKDCIGNRLSEREQLNQEGDLRLVGFKPVDGRSYLTAGSHFLEVGAASKMENDLGYMSSVAYSPTLGCPVGIGFIKDGGNRLGNTVRAVDLVRNQDIEVEICSAHFVDPEGERLRG